MKTLNEKDFGVLFVPVNARMMVKSNEKTRKVICETGFRRFRKLYNGDVFIATNFMGPY
jgi:hypothetical protein